MLDSTFVIDHLLGNPAAARRLHRIFEAGDDPIVTSIVVCEVRTGLRPDAEEHLAAFLEPLEFVHPGVDSALTAGRWRAELRGRGLALSLGDALIGASAAAVGATVLTRNARDFALMPVPFEVY